MNSSKKSSYSLLNIITIILGVLIASFLLLFGVANLINPDVPDKYLDQNIRVCVMFILTSLIIIYAIFRPYSGGILICISSLIFFIIVIINPVVVPLILFGILSIIRDRRNVIKETEK